MEYSSLLELIESIEHGTKLHIGVIFFGIKRDKRLLLPFSSTIHTGEYCWRLKKSKIIAEKCYRCRQMAIRKAVMTGEPFHGLCINGVWEYTHPVILDGNLIAIIFIGNILEEREGKKKIIRRLCENSLMNEKEKLLLSLENNISIEKCESIGKLIESYIHMLLILCPAESEKDSEGSVIMDIINFIEENLYENISISHIAELFHYNEKYVGRLFKKSFGFSIKMYICTRRIESAMLLLRNTDESITAIATKTGFENVTYFNRRFMQLTKMTPSQYRISSKNGEQIPDFHITATKIDELMRKRR